MGVLQIEDAKREGARLLLVFAGGTGSGKTCSALHVGYGLAAYDAKKVGLLDCENRRGRLLADCLQKSTRPTNDRFLIGDLVPPFSPDRYTDAVLEFEKRGIEVLIVDSGSHEHEGIGGCEDMAHTGKDGEYREGSNWLKPKRLHKRFVNTLLQCDMQIIVCLRAREKVKITGSGKDQKYESLGVLPVCEKNFMFEATASLLFEEHGEGRKYRRVKVPGDLVSFFPGDARLTADTGYAIRQWIAGGGQCDPKVERWRNRLLTACERGLVYVKECWTVQTPADIREKLGVAFERQLYASAGAYDRQRSMNDVPDAAAAINADVAAATDTVRGLPIDFDK